MLKIIDKETFINENDYDAIFCYGAGKRKDYFVYLFSNTRIMNDVFCFIDSDVQKQNKPIFLQSNMYYVYPIEILNNYCGKKIAIIITCDKYEEIIEFLSKLQGLENADFYVLRHFEYASAEKKALNKTIPSNIRISAHPKIPKKLHYCWFGGNEMPKQYKEWIDSWKKYCPDYEIIEWNESNYDITKNKYMYQAYQQKKWGFVPDYARLDIIYNHGGIYLDTDVEVIRNLDDLLYQDGFVGFERDEFVNFGSGFGAIRGLPIIKELLDYYDDKSFINQDGSLNLIASPHLQTEVLSKYGLKKNGEYQTVAGLTIFPEKAFCAKSERLRRIRCTDYTFSIHHYDGSWLDVQTRKNNSSAENLINSANEIASIECKKNENSFELLSVVVIAFNVENFIKECLDSIINQTNKKLEIIIVDDGSTDSTGKIVDEYKENHSNLKIIHKKNEGLISARKAGVIAATGKYITFVDGDDFININMYYEMMMLASKYNGDIIASGIFRDFDDRQKKEIPLLAKGYYTKKELKVLVYPRMMFSVRKMNHYLDPSLCNKLIKRELLTKIYEKVDNSVFYLCEDALVLYPAALMANTLVISDKVFYHHRITSKPASSIVTNYKDKDVYNRLERWFLNLKELFVDSGYYPVMQNQLVLYYMCKLSQTLNKRFGIDFLTTYNQELYFANTNQLRYIFPEELINKEQRIILYGAGKVGVSFERQLRNDGYNIVNWVDKNADTLKAKGYTIDNISVLEKADYDVIIIAVKKSEMYREIRNSLLSKYCISESKILWKEPIEL